MKASEIINLSPDEMATLLDRVEQSSLDEEDYRLIKGMADTISYLSQAVQNKSVSIKRLLKMLFGGKTEKAENVLEPSTDSDGESDPTGDTAKEPNPDGKPKKRKGHGRNGAAAYTGAARMGIPHQDLKPGDPCPLCPKGKVYPLKKPKVIVRIQGVAPLQGTVFELQNMRCNLCLETFTATAPDGTGDRKYDATAKAMMALLRYGSGLPLNRLENLQTSLGIPLPSSTQWDKLEEGGNKIYPAFEELKRQGAQGDCVYNDDTTMKIMTQLLENKDKGEDERTGIFTTGIMSTSGNRKIALFYTGRRHAGENLNDLLEMRDLGKPPPMQMCDALSRNLPRDFETIVLNCLVHARRKYVDVAPNFPDECSYVIETLGKVYKNDDITKQKAMTPEGRLEFHQEKSAPLIGELKLWLDKQIDQRLVEPNSGLGQAIAYMRKHWEELTRFLILPGAPLDNNFCEQALKRAILHRKNSLFYRNEHGAYIGDMYMSLIHTCNLMKVNPFKYLVALQTYSSHLFKMPSQWMPWNYEDAVAALQAV